MHLLNDAVMDLFSNFDEEGHVFPFFQKLKNFNLGKLCVKVCDTENRRHSYCNWKNYLFRNQLDKRFLTVKHKLNGYYAPSLSTDHF